MCSNRWEQDHTFIHYLFYSILYLLNKTIHLFILHTCRPNVNLQSWHCLNNQRRRRRRDLWWKVFGNPKGHSSFIMPNPIKQERLVWWWKTCEKTTNAASTIEIMWASNHHFTIHWKSLINQFGWTTTELPRFHLSDLSYKPSYLPPSHYLGDDWSVMTTIDGWASEVSRYRNEKWLLCR